MRDGTIIIEARDLVETNIVVASDGAGLAIDSLYHYDDDQRVEVVFDGADSQWYRHDEPVQIMEFINRRF